MLGRGRKILARLTPGVGEAGAAAALHLAAEALLLTSRATLASRAAAAAEDAIAAVDGAAETVAAAASARVSEACEFGVAGGRSAGGPAAHEAPLLRP